MIINFFKIAFRNLLRSKGFSFINITGLAVGMASAILILLWIQNEVSFDKFNVKGDRIYRMNNRDKFNGDIWAWSTTPKILGPTLKHENPEVEEFVRVTWADFLFSVGEKHINVSGSFADSSFFNVFSFPLVQGNPATALKGNYNIVITQKLAVKLFGDENVLGKIIRIDSNDNFTVSGVMKNLPNNTSFEFEYLLPWTYMTKLNQDDQYWGNNSVKTFVLLKPGVTQAAFDKKIKNVTIDHTKDGSDHSTTEVFTQLWGDARLYSKSENGKYVGGAIEKVRLFAIIAGFILLIACINFMNLSTARSEKRAKEVGIRKVVGGSKNSLIMQFLGESILISILAAILAIIMVEISLPGFNQLVNKALFIDFSNPAFWVLSILFILFTGLLAGSYPALYLSSFKPASVLKGTFKASHALVTPRKVLVVLQFTFAIALIICTIIVEHQIQYAQDRDAGYSKDRLVFSYIQGDINKNFDVIRNELISSGAAVSVTKSQCPITQRYSDGWGVQWPGSTEQDLKVDFIRMATDADFVKTLGVQLKQGRDIDIKKYVSDSNAILLNETAVTVMRLKDPLGQIVKSDGRDWHVVGVVKDFIFESPYQKVNQTIIFGPLSWFNVIHYKLNPNKSTKEDLALAEKIFKRYNPSYPFDYTFVDQAYAKKFDDEKRTGNLAALFAGLTILISCLGLFGLATYMAETRIKEIGVRKVLGASVTGITKLLSKDFLKLVVVSFIIASPIAYWAMYNWLQTYTYRINIPWWVFALAGLMSVIIAIATVSYQAIRAAMSNPVKSLRSE